MKEENSGNTALVVLRPEESRQLLGEATAALPVVRHAAANGRMVIVGGTTTRYVARALTGEDPGCASFAVGWIQGGGLGETPAAGRGAGPFLFDHGQISRGWPVKLLEQFGVGDVYVKGANAIDPDGNAAILLGSPTGGTIGLALPLLYSRGSTLVVPVSWNKLIPSVLKALPHLGQGRVDRVMGTPVGYMPIPAGSATVVTETTAFDLLFGLRATVVAAGGVEDCQGALVIHLQGSKNGINAAWEWLEKLRRVR